jgi:hypothetical protein
MKVDVKRSILTKFYKFLKLLGILNKFQMNSVLSLIPRITSAPYFISIFWSLERYSLEQIKFDTV